MKNKEKKAQNEKILAAFKKILVVNKTDLSYKVEKAIKQSIKKIVKMAFRRKSKVLKKIKVTKGNKVSKQQIEPQVVNLSKIKEVTKQKTETPTVNQPKIKTIKKNSKVTKKKAETPIVNPPKIKTNRKLPK